MGMPSAGACPGRRSTGVALIAGGGAAIRVVVAVEGANKRLTDREVTLRSLLLVKGESKAAAFPSDAKAPPFSVACAVSSHPADGPGRRVVTCR